MKKVVLLLVCCSTFWACDKIFKEPAESQEMEEMDAQQVVGGEKDEHGCIPSAGYIWSEVKQNCLRVFEEGYRLNPVATLSSDNVATSSAFVLFNEDKSKAEVFIPNEKAGIILDKKDKDTYENKRYKLNSTSYVLFVDNIKKYEAAKTVLKDITDVDDEMPGDM